MAHSVKIVWVYVKHLLSFGEPGILVHACVTCRQQKPWCWVFLGVSPGGRFTHAFIIIAGKIKQILCVSTDKGLWAVWVVSSSIDDMVWLDLVSRRRWAHQGSGKTQALQRSGACPLGEVTRQWPLWYPLVAKYTIALCPCYHDKRRRKLGLWRQRVPYLGTLQIHTHTRWNRGSAASVAPGRKRLGSRARRSLLGPQD